MSSDPVMGRVTVINESSYPWLVKGAYADYETFPVGEIPYFVTTNGTLLLGFSPVGNGTVIPPSPSGHALLNWTVTDREGDLVWLKIGFRAHGCDYSYQQIVNDGNCTSYDFSTGLDVSVNLTTNEAYVDGQPQGLLNFWEPALLNGGTLNYGTAFVGGKAYDVVGNASAPFTSWLFGVPPNGINDSGVVNTGPYHAYLVSEVTFGTGPNSKFGWENVNGTGYYNGGKYITVFYIEPDGAYDYWNGLAYYFSIPDYPLNQTVCNTSSGQAVGCEYTSYATTLGNYFRSGVGELGLVSTNIPLGPSQASETTTSNAQFWTVNASDSRLVVAVIVVGGVALSGAYLLSRKKWRRNATDGNNKMRQVAFATFRGY